MRPEISFLLRFHNKHDGNIANKLFKFSRHGVEDGVIIDVDIGVQENRLYIDSNYAGTIPIITQTMGIPYGPQATNEMQLLTELENYCKILDSENAIGVTGIVNKQVSENIRKIVAEVKKNV